MQFKRLWHFVWLIVWKLQVWYVVHWCTSTAETIIHVLNFIYQFTCCFTAYRLFSPEKVDELKTKNIIRFWQLVSVFSINFDPVAVLGKNIWGEAGPWSFGRQQWLSEITIEPIKNLGGMCKIWGPVPPTGRLAPTLNRHCFDYIWVDPRQYWIECWRNWMLLINDMAYCSVDSWWSDGQLQLMLGLLKLLSSVYFAVK